MAGRLQAIIFDMDGVLIDSVSIQVDAFRAFFAPYGVAFGPEQLERFNGPSTREILQVMKEEHRLSYAIDDAVQERNRIAKDLLLHARPFPGAARVVECFRLRGYRVGLASSAPREVIAQLCGGWQFDAIASGEDVAHAKPAPDVFLDAARALGLAPPDCAVVEDSPLGVQAAKAAAMYAVAVTSTVAAQRLSAADAIVDDIRRTLELPALMAGETLFRPHRPIPIEKVVLVVEADRPELPEGVARDVEASWAEAVTAGRVFNGLLANLVRFDLSSGVLTIHAGTTDYKTYYGVRRRSDYDIFANDVCVLGTSVLLETSDGQVILGQRGRGLVGGGLLHNVPGGLLNVDQPTSAKASVLAELRQELGVDEEQVRSCALVGIGHDTLSKGAELLFVMNTSLTAAEVIERHARAVDRSEAYELRGVPIDELTRLVATEPMMPASKALAEMFLETRGVAGRG